MLTAPLRQGAQNLLLNCAGLSAGDQLLILREDPEFGYYDQAIADALVQCAQELAILTSVRTLPFDPLGGALSASVIAAMQAARRTVFLSRSGDQIRFDAGLADLNPIMSYALDADMLASGFARADYNGFVALKNAVNTHMANARHIRVTCPLGTDFSGPGAAFPTNAKADVSVTRFPMSVFAPVPVSGFSGVFMQQGFLVGTGSRFYQPYACPLHAPIGLHFENTQLTDITGAAQDVAAARAHYQNVAQMFGLEPFSMHSWHAGIHPGCAYKQPAAQNFERWSGGAFGNPRLLHFHTCGHTAPGEISLNLMDPTVTVDGVAIWNNGVFDPKTVKGGAEILARHPSIRAVFDAPEQQVGQGRNGHLTAQADSIGFARQAPY